MKYFSIVCVALVVCLLAACASNEPTVNTDYDADFDFNQLQNYRWYADAYPSKEEEFRSHNDSYQRVRGAIDDYLQGRGYRQLTQGRADFLINYHVSVQENVRIDQFARYPEGGVHGGVSTGTYGSSVAIGYSTPNHGVRSYKEGTAVIDIVDVGTNRVIWRGIAEGKMSKKVDLANRRQVTREVVKLLLGQFPPQH